MRLTRIYTPGNLSEGKEVTLTASGANHVARVLRLRVGAGVNVFDGAGREFRATLTTVNGKRVAARIDAAVATESESELGITLIQGVSRSDRMDWVVQKATELGVAAIVPVIAARSVVKLDRSQAAKKQEHWRNIAIGACEQCGRARLPEIALPLSLSQYLGIGENGNGDTPHLRFVLDPSATRSLSASEVGNGDCPHFQLLIGPEGGLDDDELAAAGKAGFVSVKLGPRTLRTETAAVVALAVIQARWGDFR